MNEEQALRDRLERAEGRAETYHNIILDVESLERHPWKRLLASRRREEILFEHVRNLIHCLRGGDLPSWMAEACASNAENDLKRIIEQWEEEAEEAGIVVLRDGSTRTLPKVVKS